MNDTIKIRGELCPVNTHPTILVREEAKPYGSPDSSAPSIPPDEAHARQLSQQALRWRTFAAQRTKMRPATLLRKAVESACFSTAKRASSLAIPTKLVGVRAHQRQLWAMVRGRVPTWAPLDLDVVDSQVVVLYDGELLGRVQSKHWWLKPLVPFGVRLYLSRITGHERSGYTLGVNVVVGHVGDALDRLLDALGEAGMDGSDVDHPGGDRASTEAAQAPPEAAPIEAQRLPEHGGDGAQGEREVSLRLVSSGPSVAKPQAGSPAVDDVVLHRSIDGTARATVGTRPLPHIRRHSAALEWGYHGSGPADLALSVLHAFTDERTAERLYVRFKEEVVAAVPRAGGVIRAADVRAWLEARAEGR